MNNDSFKELIIFIFLALCGIICGAVIALELVGYW